MVFLTNGDVFVMNGDVFLMNSLFRFKFAGKFVIFRIFREMYFGDKTRFSETLFYEILSKFRSGGGYILANFRKIKSSKNMFYRRNNFRKKSNKKQNRKFAGKFD